MAPTRSQKQHRNNLMALSKNLISSPPLHAPQRMHKQERQQRCRTHTPLPIPLLPRRHILVWLWLIHKPELDRPQQRMYPRHPKDEPADETVQEVKMLVRDARHEREDIITRGQHKHQWNERKRETTRAVARELEEPDAASRGHRGVHPGPVGDTDETK